MARNDPPKEYQFKKGQSGNPKGRPKKAPGLDQILADVLSEVKGGKNTAEKIISRLALQAVKGNIRAAEVLLERAYGKVKQQIEVDEVTTIIDVKAKKRPVGLKKDDGKGETDTGKH